MRLSWLFIAFGALVAGCAGKPPQNLGLQGDALAPCPSSPNCVSTQDEDPEKRMNPLVFEEEPRKALVRLLKILSSRPRAKLVRNLALEGTQRSYLAAEFSSRIFGFVDDVEFLIDGEKKMIHFRSASRLGHSDLGVNRKRMEEISEEFLKKP